LSLIKRRRGQPQIDLDQGTRMPNLVTWSPQPGSSQSQRSENRPLETLRRQVDHLFDDFQRGY